MLMDPKSMKKQMANGTALSSHCDSPNFSSRPASEDLLTQTQPSGDSSSTTFEMSKQSTDLVKTHEGKMLPSTSASEQAPSTGFDPRRLLDPKGFDKSSRLERETNSLPELQLTPPQYFEQQQYTNGYRSNPQIDAAATKRDYDDYEGQGMGSLIEKAYNIGHREQRPQKKQKVDKTEDFEEDQQKPTFGGGGGKGGDLGEYMKQKKQEGLHESGSIPTSVVDLTQGCHLTVR